MFCETENYEKYKHPRITPKTRIPGIPRYGDLENETKQNWWKWNSVHESDDKSSYSNSLEESRVANLRDAGNSHVTLLLT